ncbi:MAG: molybdenum cofactor guanylyltransferase [Anaerolineae bacterium]|nr:molybdenum cofactor guanylyltransferase [Phycisphaerae bacterium]
MDATLCILAGGEARRMGVAKADLLVRGQPILAYLLNRLQWRGSTMLITAPSRRSPAGCERFDREVVDPVDGQGPLRGVLTALENLATSLAVIATVDMPRIEARHLNWLIEQLDRASLGVMLRRESHVEPFPSVYRAAASDVVRQRFTSGERSVAALAKFPEFVSIDAPVDWNDSVWTNLNTPDDFARFIGADSTAPNPPT